MLGNRKKAATEQSRGESASAQGWSTNNKNKKGLCGCVGVGGGHPMAGTVLWEC